MNVPGGAFHPRDMALLPDGSPVVAGTVGNSQVPPVAVVRLRSDGSLDPDFGEDGVANGPACVFECRLRLLPGGAVLVAATTSSSA